MNNTLRNAIKFVLASIVLLVFVAGAFSAGFGSAYLLTSSDVLPRWSVIAPSTVTPPTPPLVTPAVTEMLESEKEATPAAASTPAPTVTPVPIPTPMNEDEEAFQLFWEVWDLVQRNFYGELPDMREVTYAAIRGFLETLDDEHTAFIEPEVAVVLAEDATGEFEGIGAYVNMTEEGKLEIVEPFEGGGAEQAGVHAGDRVLAVDGVSIIGISLYEAIGLIRGPAGTDVVLLIERDGIAEPFEITVTRARYEIPIIDVEMRDDGVGYIRLHDFSAMASELLEEALEDLLDQEPQGIILDLRQNPGGLLQQAVEVADLFLADDVILFERWSDGTERVFEARAGDIGEDISLIVLVNGGSASASEIVAGALQDHERAMLVGEPTFGKGSVQLPFTLSDGSELLVTVARWFTPNDRALQGQGLEPDVEVPWPEPEGDVEAEEDFDPQLERAVEYILTGK